MKTHRHKKNFVLVIQLLTLLLLHQPTPVQGLAFDLIGGIFQGILDIFCLLPLVNLVCNECNPNPCLNGGTCTDQINAFECSCAEGYTGDTCDLCAAGYKTNKDGGDAACVPVCDPNPCANEGTCSQLNVNDFQCTCAAGWTGDTCTQDVDECTSTGTNPCANDGSCTNTMGSFTCTCAEGWQGGTCTDDVNECTALDDPCGIETGNGESCQNLDGTFNCTCQEGWTGTLCETALPYFPACDIDVFIVGLGWAGVGASIELQKHNNFAKANDKRPVSFKAAEVSPFVGGRANAARVASGGTPNPIRKSMLELFQRDDPTGEDYLQWHDIDFDPFNFKSFYPNGTLIEKQVQDCILREYIIEGFDCVYESTDTVGVWEPSDTVQDVFVDCGWDETATINCRGEIYPGPDPVEGNIANAYKSWDFELEALFPMDKCSAFNYPLSTYYDWEELDTFASLEGGFSSSSNWGGIADKMLRTSVENFEETIMLSTEITGISYTNPDCVVIDYVNEGTVGTMTAGSTVFTGSVGVMNQQGDSEYDTPPLFDPAVPSDQMASLRKMFIQRYDDGSYRRTTSNYQEVIVQVADIVLLGDDLDDLSTTDFLFFATGEGKKGHCHVWQNLDLGDVPKVYPGSRTFMCELSPSVPNEDDLIDDLGDELGMSDAVVEELIASTLGNIIDTTGCERTMLPLELTPPTSVDQTGKSCMYQVFPGSTEPPFPGKWGGAWSSLRNTDWTLEGDYALVKQPLLRDGFPLVHFAGEHLCYRHIGYMQGGYFSGLEAADSILESILPETDYVSWLPVRTPSECEGPAP